MRIVEREIKGIYNIGSGETKSVLEIVEMIKEMTGSSSEIEILNEAKDEIKKQYMDSTRFRKIANWTSEIPIKTGLRMTINDYIKYSEVI